MFGGWAQLAGPPEDLTDNERSPPPAPTQLDFPGYLPQNPGNPLTPASSRELFRLLCSIRRPQDITPQHLQALNLSVVPDASFQDLLPPATGSDPRGPRQTGHQDRLGQIVQELRTDHADAFREILRLPPLPGRPNPRLSHTRRFWSGLESMSQYWDSSKDRYYETSATVNDDDYSDSNTSSSDADTTSISRTERTTASETATDPPSNVQRTKQVYKGRRVGTGSAMPPTYRDDAVSALVETVAWAYNCQVRATHVPAKLAIQNLLFPVRQSYIVGRVPREKELARRGVIEGPIMGICCRVETSFGDPASNGSGECDAAKEGWREILDLAREAGVMLLLAQERAREGKEEVKPGQGRWWTVTRRWGGGPGGSMVDDDACLPERTVRHDKSSACFSDNAIPEEAVKKGPGNTTKPVTVPSSHELSCAGVARPKRKAYAQAGSSDVQSGVTQAKRGGGSGGSASGSAGGRLQQRERWKILRAGSGLWDRRIKYMRIGAPSPRTSQQSVGGGARGDADQDVVFMVSAINHHVALLSMEVSSRYLRWLAGGECEGDEQEQEQEREREQEQNTEEHAQALQLKRTRWFDLFDQADRADFVQGLWQVMDWLMREG